MVISEKEFKDKIKTEREKNFLSPYDLIYKSFMKLEYDKQSSKFFRENASFIVETIRELSWKEFLPLEKEFTTRMLESIIDENEIKNMTPIKAISWFVSEFSEYIYDLTLSNTQSRRSRAGKEFEAIIELILMGADIPIDTQGNIGKKEFMKKGLGKMVDVVSPGVVEYMSNKRNTVLISAKTTLRERWQEVPEEMGRTGAREMFLITLDETISENVLDTLYESNIQVVTTKIIKENKYNDNNRVLTFEELLNICDEHKKKWNPSLYTSEEKNITLKNIEKQMDKHKDKDFVYEYYKRRINNINR